MRQYSIYLLDKARQLQGIVSIKCSTDAEAIKYAGFQVAGDGKVVLWVRGHCPEIMVSDEQTQQVVPASAVVRRVDNQQSISAGQDKMLEGD